MLETKKKAEWAPLAGSVGTGVLWKGGEDVVQDHVRLTSPKPDWG